MDKIDKEDLRNYYRLQRAELSDRDRDTLSLAIANKSLELDIWDKKTYHIFLPIIHQREINTAYLLNILHGKDKDIVVPKADRKTYDLTNYLMTNDTVIKINSWGIPEPVDGIVIDNNRIDVVFVPLLGFDMMGNRLGYGKGFYDRFLITCKKDCIKIGLSFFEPCSVVPTDVNDVALNYCITAGKIYNF